MSDRALKSSKFLVREGKADVRLKTKATIGWQAPELLVIAYAANN